MKPGTPMAAAADGLTSARLASTVTRSATACGGGLGQGGGERQHLSDDLGSVRGLGDAHGEVVVARGAGVAVVGIALRITAGCRLEVDAADRAPADGQDDLGRRTPRLVPLRLLAARPVPPQLRAAAELC